MSEKKKKVARTKGPSEKEFREFASWCATSRGDMKVDVYDWSRFGKLVENKAQELFRPKCIECGK